MKSIIYISALLGLIALCGCEDDHLPREVVRLHYYTESFDVSGLGFEPQLKITYEYNTSGSIDKYTVQGYNPDTETMEVQRYFTFSYSDGKVGHISGYEPGESNPYIEYAYLYSGDDKVLKITEQNHAAGINSEASFAYAENGSIKASYTFSNGGAFEYEFDFATGNILSDKTTRGTQLCSAGEYTYDQHKNPFKDLGYVDYLLTNLSANNKLTENVNYTGCSFPSLIPESYTYEYNSQGYPISATILYKSGGFVAKSKKEFFYEVFSF